MRPSIVLVFFFIAQFAHGQNSMLDSLYGALKKHPEKDTMRVKILIDLCWEECRFRPENNKALALEALKISKKINFKKGIGNANGALALYYWSTGAYEKAFRHAYTMLRHHESIAYAKGIGQAYQLLALIHQLEGEFETAKVFYLRALSIYTHENLKKDIGSCYNLMGTCYLNSSTIDLANEYFLKALAIRNEINDIDGTGATYVNLAKVCALKKNYAGALKYFERSLELVLHLNNRFRLAVLYDGMGEAYSCLGEYAKAESYLLKSASVSTRIGQKKRLEETYLALTVLEKKRMRFASALHYYELATLYRDSLYSEDKARQIAEVEIKYETEKKDQAIQLLERDKKIQTLWANILVAAVIVVIIASLILYILQRYRERKNRQILNLEIDYLTTQQKELSEKFKNALSITENEKTIESQDQRLLRKAIEIVECNMADPLFGVEKMAKEMGMSRTNMHRKLKAITGFPPSELIRSIRLRKAATLLLHQNDSVGQVSFTVGFEDHSYFSKAFKKQFGVPPSEYFKSVDQLVTEVL